MKKSKVWVSGNFHTMLKKKAVEEETTILNLTETMAQDYSFFDNPKKKKKRGLIL